MEGPGQGSSSRCQGSSVPEGLQLHLEMLAMQFGYASLQVVSKAALNMGISKIVFIVYKNFITLLVLLPFAYFLEKEHRPSITLDFLGQCFLFALVGITANQGFYLLGLENTSPTFASAIHNLVPGIKFLMDAILGIEQVQLTQKDSIAKLIGMAWCVVGASIITVYKGPAVYTPSLTLNDPGDHNYYLTLPSSSFLGDRIGKNWTLGCLFLIGGCLLWSGGLILQERVLRASNKEALLSVMSCTYFFSLMQSILIATFTESDPHARHMHADGGIFAVFYVGVLTSGLVIALKIRSIHRTGGHVFVLAYQPVQTFLVAIMATVLLREEFYLGGIVGVVLIIIGLYLFVWGVSAERRPPVPTESTQGEGNGKSSSINRPMLS